MRIAIDAMGGDNAPLANIQASIEASKQVTGLDIVLTGREQEIKQCFSELNVPYQNFTIIHAPQIIEPHEMPADAFRKKKNSSIAAGIRLLKKREVEAFVSAGNTGAVVAFSILNLGRLKGVLRPALASFFPVESGCTLALDVGATSDTKSMNLFQFAIMGSIYVEKIVGIQRPTIALLSIGEERTKGKDITYEAFALLERSPLNFMGNIEGNDILYGKANVVVMEGFVGNAMLKFGESVVHILGDAIKNAVRGNLRYKIGGILLRPAIKGLFNKMSYEEYGGAALLGVDGIVIVSHGRSKVKAIKNAILAAYKNAHEKINEIISLNLQKSKQEDTHE